LLLLLLLLLLYSGAISQAAGDNAEVRKILMESVAVQSSYYALFVVNMLYLVSPSHIWDE
jgi:hypothetical protein